MLSEQTGNLRPLQAVLCGLLAIFLAAGCGEAKTERVTAATSGFEVAEEPAGQAEKAAVPTPNSRQPQVPGTPIDTTTPQKAETPPAIATQPSATPPKTTRPAPSEKTTGSPEEPRQPAPAAAAALEGFTVPEGSPDEVLGFLQQIDRVLQSGKIPGQSREEQTGNLRRMLEARVQAAVKLLDSDLPDEERLPMAATVLSSLQVLGQLGAEQVDVRTFEFAERLAKDKNAELAMQGKVMSVGLLAEKSLAQKPFDGEPYLKALAELLQQPDLGPEAFVITAQATQQLHEGGQAETAAKAYRMIGTAFVDSGEAQLEEQAGLLIIQADILDSGLEKNVQGFVDNQAAAADLVLQSVATLLANPKKNEGLMINLLRAAEMVERRDGWELAGKVYQAVAQGYAQHANAKLGTESAAALAHHAARSALLGKPLVLEGSLADGSPLDAAAYAGKPVLVYFWSIEQSSSLADVENFLLALERYRRHGLEILGVCLDKNVKAAQQASARFRLPWESLYGNGKERPALAETVGVEALPFALILNREGKVAALHATGRRLEEKLAQVLGTAPAAEAGKQDPPAATTPPPAATSPPDGVSTPPNSSAPATEPAAEPNAPAPEKQAAHWPTESRIEPAPAWAALEEAGRGGTVFVVDEGPVPAANESPDDTAANNAASAAAAKQAEEINPYAADPGLSPAELVEFILDLQDKPPAIQERAGFVDALVDAADRLLSNPEAKERFQLLAAAAKFELLHKRACASDDGAQERLMKFVAAVENDSRPAIAAEVKFLKLEQRLLEAETIELAQVPELLGEVKKFAAEAKLGERHLRLASYAVKAVNRLEQDDERERHFVELGKLFAQSEFRRLASYGKKLMKPPAGSDLVGQPLELAGQTADGQEFQWATYRGKVVVVDFWATWCGPCLAELPHVREAHEKYQGRGFDVVGVSLDDDAEALAEFLKENALPWTTLAGEGNSALAERYGVAGIPTLILVNREGKVVAQAHNIKQLTPQIEKLLAEEQK